MKAFRWHLWLLLLIFPLGCSHTPPKPPIASLPEPEPQLTRYEFEQPQMGVPFRIVLYSPNQPMAKIASHAAFKRISELNQVLSDYETDSELSELSRTAGQGRWVKVSPDLWNVLERAQGLARQSSGAFDVSVGPCVSLWRKARRIKQLPPPELLAEARQAVGYQKILLDPAQHAVKLTVPGMRLDLGGIAKGYAVDEALKAITALGIKRALVAGSGDMAASLPPPGKPGWRIEVAPLDITNAPPKCYVILSNMALATSGDVFQKLEIDGKRYSHIVDPRTGLGLTDHSLVTIIARECATADPLATTISVLGPQKGLKLLKNYPGACAHLVRKPSTKIEFLESSGFKKFYAPAESEKARAFSSIKSLLCGQVLAEGLSLL